MRVFCCARAVLCACRVVSVLCCVCVVVGVRGVVCACLVGDDLVKLILQQHTFELEETAEHASEKKGRSNVSKKKKEKGREFELAKLKPSAGSVDSTQELSVDSSVRGHMFPTYQGGEDIPAFIIRFEHIALLLEVKEDALSVRLGSLLTGKTAELYSTLGTNIIRISSC